MSNGLGSRIAAWQLLAVSPLVFGAFVLLIDRQVQGASRMLVLALIMLAIGFVVGGWFLLIKPALTRVRAASQIAEQLVTGDFSGRTNDTTSDEIGDLSRGLDRLAQDFATESRNGAEFEHRLRHTELHDPLTGLANRQHFVASVTALLDGQDGRTVSLVMVDLNDFRLVNDLWGHEVGDEVLCAVAYRLRHLLGDDALVARWSGDEFAVLLANVDGASLTELAARVDHLFDEPITTSVGPYSISASVGLATMPSGAAEGIDQLLHGSNIAMAEGRAAREGAGAISPETARLVELALEHDRLEVWYQPVVSMQSPTETRMVGVEAFARIRADDGTLRVPGEFMNEIMTSGYAREIDRRVAEAVGSHLAAWRAHGLSDDFHVSLNLSPASLRDAELGRSLLDLCHSVRVAPNSIVLDVSEEAGELDQIIAAELRHHGFRLSIDDLGLKRSNFDRLFSIGAEFAKLHPRWLEDETMLAALVTICQSKGLQVVAKGVETMDQLSILHKHQVRLCQGYLISRPVSFESFSELLAAGRRPTQQPA